MTAARRVLRCWPVVLPLVAIVELVLHFVFAARAPALDAYRDLRPAVDALWQPGDLVVMAPRWAEPMARQALGDARMPLADLARPDTTGYAAAIEISALGQRTPELAGWREVERREHGELVLRRLENPAPSPAKLDFVSALDRHVEVEWLDGRPCSWRDRAPAHAGGFEGHTAIVPERFVCSSNRFFFVGKAVINDSDFRPRRCIWAHPPVRGELVIRYRDVELGQRIVGHAAVDWMFERPRTGAPVVLAVRVGNTEIGSFTHRDGQSWSAFDMPLGELSGSRADVEFRVRSDDHRHRHFCFEARTR